MPNAAHKPSGAERHGNMFEIVIDTPDAARAQISKRDMELAVAFAENVVATNGGQMVMGDTPIPGDVFADALRLLVPEASEDAIIAAATAKPAAPGLNAWKLGAIWEGGTVRFRADEVAGAVAIYWSWQQSGSEADLAFVREMVAGAANDCDSDDVEAAWATFYGALAEASRRGCGLRVVDQAK